MKKFFKLLGVTVVIFSVFGAALLTMMVAILATDDKINSIVA